MHSRQGDQEPDPLLPLPVEVHTASRGCDHPLNDRQAQPESSNGTAQPLVTLLEGLQDLVTRARWQTGPPVSDHQGHLAGIHVQAYLDGRAAVAPGVLDQLVEDDLQIVLADGGQQWGDAGAEALRRDLEAAFEPVTRAGGEVTVTSGSIVIAEMSDALASFQLRAIAMTLAVVLVLLVAYYGRYRRPLLGAFVVLTFSGLPPIRSLGLLGGAAIGFSLLAAILVQPGALVIWARRGASSSP